MADLSAYLRSRFQGSEKLRLLAGGEEQVAEVIQSLTSRSSGNFLIISKILSSMEHNEISIYDPEALPSELEDLYAWFLDRLTRGDGNKWRDLYRPVLVILAAAFEPMDVPAYWQRFDLYGLRYLPSHLAAAAEWKSLYLLLTDFGFMGAKARSLSVYELEADYRNTLKSLAGDEEGRSVLMAFEECFRLQAHHINPSPGLLFPHLYNHLIRLDVPGEGQEKGGPIFRICKDAEHKHFNWLKMVQDPRPAPHLWLSSLEGHTALVSSVAKALKVRTLIKKDFLRAFKGLAQAARAGEVPDLDGLVMRSGT